MSYAKKRARILRKLLLTSALGVSFVVVRSAMKTPQPLKSVLPGEEHLYKWTQGHIFYKVFGAEDAPPLVLLHAPEIGASAYEMRHLINGLAKNYRVYAPDLLGFGLSDHPHVDYSAHTYLSLLEDFLAHVVQQPAVIMASGLSCNYAVAVAHRRPELCVRLVLLSPTPLYKRQHVSALRRYSLANPFLSFVLYTLLTERWPLRSLLAKQRGIARAQVTRAERDYVYAASHQRGGHYAACAYLAGRLDLDVEQQLATLSQPTLIIWGEQSVQPLPPEWPTSAATGSRRATVTANATQVMTLPETGSHLQEERPTKVVDRVLSWHTPDASIITSTDEEEEPETLVASEEATERTAVAGPQQIEITEESIPTAAETIPSPQTEAYCAYCIKCRQKRPMQNAKQIVTKNGRNAMEGHCPVCGTRLFRFIAR
ncbi:alpha/beta hydrolase [Ktedonobacteria bacterium brp13]|nr:alpha/beta hydrolase [Ktedonobacteria bacterium brp13]